MSSLASSSLLVIIGIFFMLASLAMGVKLRKILPLHLREKWNFLLVLTGLFLCGYMAFLFLLISRFPFQKDILSSSIFFSGAIFVFLVISFTEHTIRQLRDTEAQLKQNNENLAMEVTFRRQAEEKIRSQSDMILRDLVDILDEMLANRDRSTYLHAAHVSEISKLLGKELGLNDDDLKAIEIGCLVHDIGKTAIPDDVLLKPGKFDSQDRAIMEYHPLMGAKIFARHLHDERITNIILKHHERLDGSGYPAGLKGDEIDIFSRIVAVADIYESLIARRPYKQSMSPDEALVILEEEAAHNKIDSSVVKILQKIKHTIPKLEGSTNITAGFMQDVELFRSKTYFREPLTDFYNYRYLHFLNDAKVLRNNTLSYDLILIHIPAFGAFQQKTGHMVADQILDELGHKLLKTASLCSGVATKQNDSVMLFRKGKDYLLYSEYEKPEKLDKLLHEIKIHLQDVEQEWGLIARSYRRNFAAGFPLEKALTLLFAKLEDEK